MCAQENCSSSSGVGGVSVIGVGRVGGPEEVREDIRKELSMMHILALVESIKEVIFSVHDLLKVLGQLFSWEMLGQGSRPFFFPLPRNVLVVFSPRHIEERPNERTAGPLNRLACAIGL